MLKYTYDKTDKISTEFDEDKLSELLCEVPETWKNTKENSRNPHKTDQEI